jgi:hypothetical protein
VAVPVESEILNRCRPDLRDLRVVDSSGEQKPSQILPSAAVHRTAPYPVRVFRVLREHDQWTDIWIDKTTKSLAECLIIKTPSNGFLRNVEIRGSDNARDAYVIRQDGLIAAFGAPVKLRSLDIRHPVNNFQYLHVRVHDDGDSPIKIAGAECCPPGDVRKPIEQPLRIVDIDAGEDDRTISIMADLGETRHPIRSVEVESRSGEYLAKAEVSLSDSISDGSWKTVHSGVVFRLRKKSATKARNRLMFKPDPSRYLKLDLSGKIPDVEGLRAESIMMVLVFKRTSGESYRMIYGNPAAKDKGPILKTGQWRLKDLLDDSKDIQVSGPQRVPIKKVEKKEPKKKKTNITDYAVSLTLKICGAIALLVGLLLIFRAMLKTGRRSARF